MNAKAWFYSQSFNGRLEPESEVLQCPICCYETVMREKLRLHIEREHGGDNYVRMHEV